MIYLLSGEVVVLTDSSKITMQAAQGLMIEGDGCIQISALSPARLIYLSGSQNDEPKVMHGSFLMNTQREIEDAIGRFKNGEMGELQ